jgi:hypothetical protein
LNDPRDRIIDIAVAISKYRERRRVLGRLIRQRPCLRPKPDAAPCYRDGRWKDDLAAPADYCDACHVNLELAVERHAMREAERSALARLDRAVGALKVAQDQSRFIPFLIARAN